MMTSVGLELLGVTEQQHGEANAIERFLHFQGKGHPHHAGGTGVGQRTDRARGTHRSLGCFPWGGGAGREIGWVEGFPRAVGIGPRLVVWSQDLVDLGQGKCWFVGER